ncbi:MAG: beta strand repeat-containing protein, partial [Dokdonella sp.]|uniref:beta strand repeat-containing protein n=1 Tax=Dokdonella sp. TaxID=2291710 RepID=UPI003F7F3C57
MAATPMFATTAHAALGVCDAAPPVEVEATAGTTGPTSYPTLKAAFDAINAGTHQGSIAVEICGDTSESASAVLGASSGAASYTDISVKPVGGAARIVSGAIAAGGPLVDLAGATHVTIDGLNSAGNSLTLSNTTVSATAGTSTVRFINGASNNTITHATILGSSSATAATAGGNVLFSTSTVAGGNSNNMVVSNRIGPAGASLMTKGVMGLGTAANPNVGNTIADNDIFDFFSATVSSAGVSIQANNNNWTIASNRIFQTAPRTFTATAQRYSGILVASGGNAFSVTGNRIGFGASDGTGTTTISGSTNEFRGIAFTNSSTTAGNFSLIAGNTISGINVTSGRNSTTTDLSSFIGIQSGSSATDAPATITGNTIGSLDGSSTIVVNASSTTANTSPVQGILDFNFVGNVSITGNNIGSITINNGGTGTVVGFRGILVGSTTGVTHTVSGNTVGGSAAGAITDNIVGSVAMYGIQLGAANVIANGNVVSNMVANSTTPNGVVLSGILSTGSTGANTISQNTIHSLSNNSGAASNSIYALYCSFASVAGNLVERNFVHSLSINSTATTSQLVGILPVAGSGTYQNNMVRLGFDAAGQPITSGYVMYGMFEIAGTNNIYNNSLFVGGSGVASASNTFGLVSNVTTGTRNYIDNIIWNARSNASGTGSNYAISLAAITGATTNFNDLYASGTGGITGSLAATDAPTLAAWQLSSGQDANSISSDPLFAAANGTFSTVDLHLLAGSPAAGAGVSVGSVTTDIDGDPRPASNPAIGADEPVAGPVTHVVTPSVGTPSGTISPNTPQTVNDGATASFTLTAAGGFHIDNVTGTCGGSLAGNTYTTNAVTADCTVIANFAADIVNHTVTGVVGTPSGSITPASQSVVDGATATLTETPSSGFHIDTIGGTCGGSLAGNTYTTNAVTADCTVIANFAADIVNHTVTGVVGTPSGSITPASQSVVDGATATLTVTANSGFHIDTVTGCGGSMTGANTYTTGAVTADCTVVANFAADGGGGTFPPDENFDEVTAPALPAGWVTSTTTGTDFTTVTTASDTAPNAAFAT